MSASMNQFRETFFDEAQEHLGVMEAALLVLEDSPDDPDQINSLFRAAHSIKGSGGTFGLSQVADFAHAVETLLDAIRQGELDITPERIDLLLDSCDCLTTLLACTRAGDDAPDTIDGVLLRLREGVGATICSGTIAADGASGQEPATPAGLPGDRQLSIRFGPSMHFFSQAMDPLLLIDDLRELGTAMHAELDTARLPALDEMHAEECYLAWTIHLTTAADDDVIQDVFMFVDDETETTINVLHRDCDRSSDANCPGCPAKNRTLLVASSPEGSGFAQWIADLTRVHHVSDPSAAAAAVRLAIHDGRPYRAICVAVGDSGVDWGQWVAGIREQESQHDIFGRAASQVVFDVTSATDTATATPCYRKWFHQGCDVVIAPALTCRTTGPQ